MNKLVCLVILTGWRLALAPLLPAQSTPAPVTAAERQEVVERVAQLVHQHYILPGTADKVAAQLRANEQSGVYNGLREPAELADRLTTDLVAASHDKHFHLFFDPAWVQDSRQARTKRQREALANRDLATWQQENFGFREIKILEGNVGYLNLEMFRNADYAHRTAAGAMEYLRHTNAVIIDLRGNGGGFGNMAQLLISYFMPPKRVLILNMYQGRGKRPHADYTRRRVPGPRRPAVDLYLLTGRGTFSAAEAVANFFKNRKRATLVGETTGGGANPIERKAVTDRFYLSVPTGRPVDPITGTNWEGTGVVPDVSCAAPDALNTAYLLALNRLMARDAPRKAAYQWAAEGVQARLHPASVAASTLRTYAGTYGARQLLWENNGLYYQRTGEEKYPLVPMSDDTFLVEQAPYLRLKVVRQDGRVRALHRLYNDGSIRTDARSE